MSVRGSGLRHAYMPASFQAKALEGHVATHMLFDHYDCPRQLRLIDPRASESGHSPLVTLVSLTIKKRKRESVCVHVCICACVCVCMCACVCMCEFRSYTVAWVQSHTSVSTTFTPPPFMGHVPFAVCSGFQVNARAVDAVVQLAHERAAAHLTPNVFLLIGDDFRFAFWLMG